MKSKRKGPQFLRFFTPLIKALKELGGSGKKNEVVDLVIKNLKISEKETEEKLSSGESRVRNQIAWARLYLVQSGIMDYSKRGVWSLTEKGFKANLTYGDILKMFKDIQGEFKKEPKGKPQKLVQETVEEKIEVEEQELFFTEEVRDEKLKENLIQTLLKLSPSGFERICQRLLRESGFQKVIVTGRSGDGGIDGQGILEINPLVSFKVIFQCKRYKGSVTPSQVRDFRGAMAGRADKGIILTTGRFTREAKEEAIRDGADPIELIDGEKLVDMFQKLELGLKPKVVYEIDSTFFDEYK